MIISIDPGNEQSASVIWRNELINKSIKKNDELLEWLRYVDDKSNHILVIEMIACYGMPVGKTVFETVLWIGRFIEAWGGKYELIYRKDIKMYLCNSNKAKDSNVRQALIDKFEPNLKPRERPKGILKGISKDLWAALALAVYYSETGGSQWIKNWRRY